MPLYSYKCNECEKESDSFFKIADRKKSIECPFCHGRADKTYVANVQRDEPTWLESATRVLLPEGNDVKKIESRTQFNRYLKENNIVQTG